MKSIVWFTNNLRVADNPLLTAACKNNANEVVGVYCLNPEKLDGDLPKIGPFRAKFNVESLLDLKRSLEELNIPFAILLGDPTKRLPEYINENNIGTLYFQKVWHEEEVLINKEIEAKISPNIQLVSLYDQFLLGPEIIPFELYKLPKVFTPFRKKVEATLKVPAPLEVPAKQTNTSNTPLFYSDALWASISKELLSIKIDSRSAFPFKGGENAAQERIDHYFFSTDHVAQYKETRNGLIGLDYSTKLSAWLANGCISARTIYYQLKAYEKTVKANESTYWVLFELLWREFFKYVGLKHKNDLFKSGGINHKSFAQGNDPKVYNDWISGTTHSPFINANMKELSQTGWMSNRGRQNVASYWSKTLDQDWRIGATYFESQLIDYDVDSNWANWMYTSGVGNDPRDRIFNPDRQADMYDPQKAFQKLWNN
ncbi:DASH family cryptochrome [Flavobacteriaceae bacterium]|nr:DASH family cryptochrome [Flavobacteriaceae bacterium]